MNKENFTPGLKHPIKTRHLVMLSLGGAIGTGLFLGSGEVINNAGSLGAILAYIFAGAVTYMVMMCLGELASAMPVSNSFSAYATKNINPATGYMIAWVYWVTWALTLGVDFTAAAILVTEWFPQIPVWTWVIVFSVLILVINLYSTKMFAEAEFYLSLIKVATVLIFILLGILILAHVITPKMVDAYPAQYLNNFKGNNLFHNGLSGIFSTMLLVSFSFTGTELIAVAAGETQDPKKSIPAAIKATFWRLLIMFIGTIIIIAFLFPKEQLGFNSQQVSTSPFVLLFNELNIPYAKDVVRFVIITALLSSANAGLYGASRMLWSLSDEHKLSNWLTQLSLKGVPVYAVLITVLGAVPGLLLKYFDVETVLNSIIDLAAFTMVIVWMSICISQYNFRKQLIKDNQDIESLAYHSPFYPYLSIIGFIFLFITACSMLINPAQIYSFIVCLLFVAGCYLHYFLRIKK